MTPLSFNELRDLDVLNRSLPSDPALSIPRARFFPFFLGGCYTARGWHWLV
jgi:hypothetical protein